MVFYLETCESGSMFVNLRNDTKIYALSAANPSESSWATYCYPNDMINGTHIDSCLGDLFSVNWMEDAETGLELSETLQKQFEKVRYETDLSQVMQWGDISLASEPIGNFLGARVGSNSWLKKKMYNFKKSTIQARKSRLDKQFKIDTAKDSRRA